MQELLTKGLPSEYELRGHGRQPSPERKDRKHTKSEEDEENITEGGRPM